MREQGGPAGSDEPGSARELRSLFTDHYTRGELHAGYRLFTGLGDASVEIGCCLGGFHAKFMTQ